jgi:outer membrane protein assembly factor BamD
MMTPQSFFRTLVHLAFVCLILASASGCALFGRSEMKLNSPEALYERGVEYYQKEKYSKAIEAFQRVKEEYPLSKYALMAELGIADSYFSDDHFVEAEINYNEFINLHPTNPNVPYVVYQLGMCHYKQMMSIDRDQIETTRAKKEFERILAQFPSSKFAPLAEQKLRECRQRLAENEFYVGHFYFKSKQYKAALKRFEIVARDYSNLGLDYKVNHFIEETKRRIDREEKEKLAREKAEKEKQQEKELKKQKDKKDSKKS